MCCKGTSAAFHLQPLAMSDIQSLQQRASHALSLVSAVSNLSGSEYRVGITLTPDGMPLYFSAFGKPGSLQSNWDVVLHIPLGPLEVVLYIKNITSDKKLHMKATLLMGGSTIAETEFDVKYGDILPFNNIGFVDNLIVKSNHPSILDDCLVDCIKRHAPSCVGPCLSDPTGWSCIICSGGSIACCLINCHC